MSRKRFDDMPCSIARSLDVVGDWWTLLIIRDVFLGQRRFGDFHASLGIARNILSDRLRKLVAMGILAKQPSTEPGHRHDYRLTAMGRDLWPVLTALRLWGDKWVIGPGNETLVVEDRDSGAVLAQLVPADADGNPLDRRRLVAKAGPGLTPELARRYRR